ncbi:hypothetical protein [Sphingomonas sp. BAUL-RG-20F-R05-02]|uniref:hypothetical protein n=1 Tax=Sphingomonas sp. BAUL-RG-20F-R05-02 TaxID=2914830 RepID=UPI001F5A9C53|nr:hypothetical protein [Sphingomonas sp. BAUL-RG-20F-R05-02]
MAAFKSGERFLITALVRGTDTLLASATMGSFSYQRQDIRPDHDFVDMISNHDGVLHLDMALLHDTRPLLATGPVGNMNTAPRG